MQVNPLTYGSVVATVTTGGFDILLSSYHPFEEHPVHCHDRPAFVYVIDGAVSVRSDGNEQHCPRASMRLIPAGDRHQTRYGQRPARCLVMGVSADRQSTFPVLSRVLSKRAYHEPRTPATVFAERIRHEVEKKDDATPLAVEALMLEMLTVGIRISSTLETRLPQWLVRTREMIDADFRKPLSVTSLAVAANVHPVHLSRTFRRHFNCSIANYQRRLRLEWARARLIAADETVGRIAIEAGFADHSEFTRRFFEVFGVSPSRFRSGLQR
ncbi:MAG TPA: AraC family transcriptional regulator [Gemmatimonadaceae bacterium]|nr:AraC family transcriptional regulator [Gemmatimonadaceae bacterium]